MTIRELFESPAMKLPRDRDDDDFERYLKNLFEAYLAEICRLDNNCGLSSRIKHAYQDILHLSEWIRNAVHEYLAGQPHAAYGELVNGIEFVAARLDSLKSVQVGPDAVERLYRIRNTEGKLEWSPKLRQPVKAHFSENGELSYGSVSKAVYERVQAGRRQAAGTRGVHG